MIRRRLFFVPIVALAVTPLAAYAAGSRSTTARSATVRLTRDVIPGISRLHAARQVSGARQLHVGISLSHPDRAGEAALARAQADPKSPQYRRFLTPAEFDARFGVAPARMTDVLRWATSTGLRVASVAGAHDYALLTGTAAQAERLFDVRINEYEQAGTRYYANAQAPAVPAALGIAGVTGLDDVHRASVHPHLTPAAAPTPSQGQCLPAGCTGPLDISDLWSAYNMPTTNRGSGASIAVFGEGSLDPVVVDLRAFEKAYKLPRVNVRAVPIADDFTDTGGLGEFDLDTQASTGVAPDVRELVLYWGNTLAYADIDAAFTAWVDDPNGPLQGNASFGGCEPTLRALDPVLGRPDIPVGTQSVSSFDTEIGIFSKAVLEGRTLFASTGDQGSSCYWGIPNAFENTVVPLLNTPAALPGVVGVGGTVLYTTGGDHPQRVLERALDASGGGVSVFIPASPAQQSIGSAVVVPPIPKCLVDHDANPYVPPPQCRSLPDVVADSGDISVVAGGSGLAIYSGGAPTDAAGTSLSSPLMTGMWARVQAASKNATGLGFAANTFYGDATSAHGADDFYDVIVGGNGLYYAQPRTPLNPTGYDYAGGLGVPNVSHFMESTTGRVTPTRPIVPIPLPDPITVVCHGGLITDRAGDAVQVLGVAALPAPAPSDPHVDIVSADTTFEQAPDTLVFTIKVTDLGAVPPEGEYFRYDFSYADKGYEMVMSRTLAGQENYSVRDTSSLQAPTILDGLAGSFDDATSTITGRLPLDKFNAAAKPKAPMKAGSQIGSLSVLGQQYTTGVITDTEDDASTGCPFTLLGKIVSTGPPVPVTVLAAGATKGARRLPATGFASDRVRDAGLAVIAAALAVGLLRRPRRRRGSV